MTEDSKQYNIATTTTTTSKQQYNNSNNIKNNNTTSATQRPLENFPRINGQKRISCELFLVSRYPSGQTTPLEAASGAGGDVYKCTMVLRIFPVK